MKKVVLSILVFSSTVFSFSVYANEEFLKKEAVQAQSVPSVPLAIKNPIWSKIKAQEFTIYPQKTVELNDKVANAAIKELQPKKLQVKVIYSAAELGIMLSWQDDNKTLFSRKESNTFGDSFAVEFPETFGEGHRLPYIGMGDEKYNVFVYMARSAEEGVLTNAYKAAGFGSLTRIKQSPKFAMEYNEKSKIWTAVFVRPFKIEKHNLKQGLVPVAFAIWDGSHNERGGNKMLTSWKFIRLGKEKVSTKYMKDMSFGYNPGDLGDAAKGRELVTTTCAACHHVAGQTTAQKGMAPNLANIGGIATHAYLRDSIMNPSEVTIRHLNINRHYDKGQEPDKFKAYPNNEVYTWYAKDDKGVRHSKMPPFAYLSAQDATNVITFLKSLQ